jgi:hypothetical protein
VVIGTGDHDATCRFGFALPIWSEEGRKSWDGMEWQPEWGVDSAQMLCYDVFEEDDVPIRPPCAPDENGVTWIAVPGWD